jgi:carboxymethylenebutenolidase
MSLSTDSVRFGKDREYAGYLAFPARARKPLPAIVVIQEAWGVDAHIEDLTRRFALAGYAALAPDLYARNGARPDVLSRERAAEMKDFFDTLPPADAMNQEKRAAALAAEPEPRRSRIAASLDAMFATIRAGEANLAPLLAATRFLREDFDVTRGQRVGSVGFCMGGGLSALLASADPELAGAVIFYGMAPAEEKVATIACPVLGFYGALDQRVNAGLAGLIEAMRRHGRTFEHHVYEGAGHAFFNDTRRPYDVRAARDAFTRTVAFFRDRLP